MGTVYVTQPDVLSARRMNALVSKPTNKPLDVPSIKVDVVLGRHRLLPAISELLERHILKFSQVQGGT